MILFLFNYFAVSQGKMNAKGKIYNTLQIVAAAAIAVSLLPVKAWPTIVLEVFFVLIGMLALMKKKG